MEFALKIYFNLLKIYFILNTLKSIFVNTDTASGVRTNAHEDAFSAPRTNVRLVAVFGAFKVQRVHSCALHLLHPLGYYLLKIAPAVGYCPAPAWVLLDCSENFIFWPSTCLKCIAVMLYVICERRTVRLKKDLLCLSCILASHDWKINFISQT